MAAVFRYRDKTLRLALKPEYERRVQDIIAEAMSARRALTPAYFEAIEKAAYPVWADFDRHEIFESSSVQP